MNRVESKLSQYADDPTSVFDGNQKSSFGTFDASHKISGLQVNNEKQKTSILLDISHMRAE